jgi:hypothetical protein
MKGEGGDGVTCHGHKRFDVPAERARLVVVGAGTVLIAEGLVSFSGCEVTSTMTTLSCVIHPGVRAACFMAGHAADREHLTGITIVLAGESALGCADTDRGHERPLSRVSDERVAERVDLRRGGELLVCYLHLKQMYVQAIKIALDLISFHRMSEIADPLYC